MMPRPPDAVPPPPPRPVHPPRHHLPAAPPRYALAVGIALLLAPLLVGLLLRVVDRPFFQGLDDRWAASMDGSPADAATGFATVLDRLGGPLGLILPLMLCGCLCVYGRWRSGLYVFVANVLASMVVVLPLKQFVDRPRPPYPWVLVNDGSYPSGQVFSAVTLMVVAAVVLFPPRARRWWWLFGAMYVVAMMWSRTWLHAQWFSDTLAGALAGVGACLLLWRAFAPLLKTEAERAAADSLWL
ncbi:phosphatase PAP2 family protein [Streptomyces sp. NBC_01353]|uniref:phosphatase PAP2 family protein n=1 Tax=Streptomyces sp. NBC_01353 TaxID=2903835 RepID=UPI002E321EEA|nr:phosphatase PAP2 family protein [Streptomyces sp. NBC_01353]